MSVKNKQWEYVCPVCNCNIVEKYKVKEIKEYVGATHDCPKCNGLLMIQEDLTCSDFGEELTRRYEELGVKATKEEATSSFIEV